MAGTGVASVRDIRLDRRRRCSAAGSSSSCPKVCRRARGPACKEEEEEAGDAALSHDASVLDRWRLELEDSTREGASDKRVAMLACVRGQGGSR